MDTGENTSRGGMMANNCMVASCNFLGGMFMNCCTNLCQFFLWIWRSGINLKIFHILFGIAMDMALLVLDMLQEANGRDIRTAIVTGLISVCCGSLFSLSLKDRYEVVRAGASRSVVYMANVETLATGLQWAMSLIELAAYFVPQSRFLKQGTSTVSSIALSILLLLFYMKEVVVETQSEEIDVEAAYDECNAVLSNAIKCISYMGDRIPSLVETNDVLAAVKYFHGAKSWFSVFQDFSKFHFMEMENDVEYIIKKNLMDMLLSASVGLDSRMEFFQLLKQFGYPIEEIDLRVLHHLERCLGDFEDISPSDGVSAEFGEAIKDFKIILPHLGLHLDNLVDRFKRLRSSESFVDVKPLFDEYVAELSEKLYGRVAEELHSVNWEEHPVPSQESWWAILFMENVDAIGIELIKLHQSENPLLYQYKDDVVDDVVNHSLQRMLHFLTRQTFNKSGFQQIQLDLVFLASALERLTSRRNASEVCEHVFVSIRELCALDAIPMPPSRLDSLLQEGLTRLIKGKRPAAV